MQNNQTTQHTVIQPQTEFDVKIKNKDLTIINDEEFNNLLQECKDKSICIYFSNIKESQLAQILEYCSTCSYLNTSQDNNNIALVYKFSNNIKLSSFLTHMTYEQYGEMVHPIKMMMETMNKNE